MKLLFDQNISFRIVKAISEIFNDCIHVSKVDLMNATDMEIWTFTKKMDYTIVTFDADFLNLATLKGHPPKIILLKAGNRTTKEITSLLIKNKDLIDSFLQDINYSMIACLEIS